MNIQSYVLLAVAVAAFAFALWRFVRKNGRGGCGSCRRGCDCCHKQPRRG
ncbi:MAG: FeoB-associated Cys-rich membrane protein [Prevotellaceae bacterium]|nr:FeoB-associated Cys-rich membrane protein [Prevotellaceae bacterium]